MKTLINQFCFCIGTLAFCGLLAWLESTPMTDAAVYQFADAFTAACNILGL